MHPKVSSKVIENAGFLKCTGRSIRLSTLSTLEISMLSTCMTNSVTKSNSFWQLLRFVLFAWINGHGLYGNFKYDLIATQQIDIWGPLSPSCWLSLTVTYFASRVLLSPLFSLGLALICRPRELAPQALFGCYALYWATAFRVDWGFLDSRAMAHVQ